VFEGKAFSMNMFDAPAPPPITPPAPMPDPDDPAAVAARRKKVADTMARAGRRSTILTDAGGGTNYDSYAGTSLGAQ
jgi:hypothetical protein